MDAVTRGRQLGFVDVPEAPQHQGLQVVRGPHHLEFEPGVTVVVGPNGSGSPTSSTRSPGCSAPRGPARSGARRWRTSSSRAPPRAPALGRSEVSLTIDNASGKLPGRPRRGDDHAHAVPQRRVRVRDQRRAVPAPRHPRAAQRLGRRSPAAHDHRAGPARPGAQRATRGPPQRDRGGGRRPQAPPPQGARRAPARDHPGEPRAPRRPRARGATPDAPLERQAAAARSHAELAAELAAVRRYLYGHEHATLTARERELATTLRTIESDVRELRQRTRTLDAQASAATAELSSRREEELAGRDRRAAGRCRAASPGRSASSASGATRSRRRSTRRPTRTSSRRSRPTPPSSPAELEAVTIRRKGLDHERAELTEAEASLRADLREFEATWGAEVERRRDRRLRAGPRACRAARARARGARVTHRRALGAARPDRATPRSSSSSPPVRRRPR